MKIWGNIPKVSGVYGNTSKIDKLSRVSEVASKKDELTISGTAQDFNVVMKALRQVPDVRQEKVNDILQKMEHREYSVTSRDVAAKIVEAMKTEKI